MISSNSNGREGEEVVGAAELSPIELKDVVIHNNQQQQHLIRYVTDVVTSSSSRRLGVGSSLMNYIEQTAYNDMGIRCLLLHVEESNDLARQFYEKLNYVYVDKKESTALTKIELRNDDLVIHIDSNRLAMNAGTTGQLLMMKELTEPLIIEEQEEVVKKGFGKQSTKKRKRAKGGRS
jgi:ribosomal protein S18 acetylase RimI-like enzyme